MTFTKKDLEEQEKKRLELQEELARIDKVFFEQLEKLGLTEDDLDVDIKDLPPELAKIFEEEKKLIEERSRSYVAQNESGTVKKRMAVHRSGIVKL